MHSGLVQRYLARRFAADRANRQMCSRCQARPHLFVHQVRRRAPIIGPLHHWHRPGSLTHAESEHVTRSATKGESLRTVGGMASFLCIDQKINTLLKQFVDTHEILGS